MIVALSRLSRGVPPAARFYSAAAASALHSITSVSSASGPSTPASAFATPLIATATSTASATTTATASTTANAPPQATATASATARRNVSRPTRKLRPRKAAVTISPAAVAQLRQLLDQPDPKLIRVGVKSKGCSGLAYHLEYVEQAAPFDEEVIQDGVKVLIDSKALFSIIGSEMDWVEDKLHQKFVFHNPNIKEQCGCGESFMV